MQLVIELAKAHAEAQTHIATTRYYFHTLTFFLVDEKTVIGRIGRQTLLAEGLANLGFCRLLSPMVVFKPVALVFIYDL